MTTMRLLFAALALMILTGCGTVTTDSSPTQGMSPMQKRIWASP